MHQTYEAAAATTEAPIDRQKLLTLRDAESCGMMAELDELVDRANIIADNLKRAVFYQDPKRIAMINSAMASCCESYPKPDLWQTPAARLLHAALGKLTEAFELFQTISDKFGTANGFSSSGVPQFKHDRAITLEAVHDDRFRQQLQSIYPDVFRNIVEEIGDSQWYDALFANVLGVTFEQIQQANIKKLQKRYPDLAFNPNHAVNRDTEHELSHINSSPEAERSEAVDVVVALFNPMNTYIESVVLFDHNGRMPEYILRGSTVFTRCVPDDRTKYKMLESDGTFSEYLFEEGEYFYQQVAFSPRIYVVPEKKDVTFELPAMRPGETINISPNA